MRAKSVSNLQHFPVNYLAVVSPTVHLEAIARQGAVAYEDLDHVRITRDFLHAPHRYLSQSCKKVLAPNSGARLRGELGDGRGGYRIPIDTPI